jgi:hypothetical protein
MLFIPFLYDQIYGICIVQLFLIIPLAIGFRNLFNLKNIKYPKLVPTFIIIILVVSSLFSGFFNHYRTGQQWGWYMDEKTFTASKWIDHNINKEKRILIVGEDAYNCRPLALQTTAPL